MTPQQAVDPADARESACLLALALAAEAVGAVSYLGLGRVFTANMIGNTVLLGVALAPGIGPDTARSAAALGGFCAGAAAGVAVVRPPGQWPQREASVFWLESAGLPALLVLWAAAGGQSARLRLIALALLNTREEC